MNKQRNWAWFFIMLFPVFTFFLILAFNQFTFADIAGSGTSDNSFLANTIGKWFTYFQVGPFYGWFRTFFENKLQWFPPQWIMQYCSYLMFCFFIRIPYEVWIFLPKWLVSFFERWSKK